MHKKEPSTNLWLLSMGSQWLFDWFTLSRGAINIFSNFLGSVVGVQRVKHLARKAAVSAFTEGVLWPSDSTHNSLNGSSEV